MEEPSFLEELSQSQGVEEIADIDEVSVEEMLQRPVTFRLFRTADPHLVEFFVNHVEDLLKLTFFSDKKDLSAKAFSILEHSLPQLTIAMLENQRFNNAACGVLSHIESGSIILARLSSLTLSALLIDPHYIINSCGFILQLLCYVDDVSVFSLFESLCSPNEEIADVQQWLVDIGFVQLLIKEIDSMSTEVLSSCTRADRNGLLMCGYLNIIKLCAKSVVLRKEVKNSSVFAIINRNVCEWADFIEDARWEALASLSCKKTQEVMRTLFQQCIEMLTDPKRYARRCAVAAVNILTFMVRSDKILTPFIQKMEVCKLITELVMNNPNHSILNECCVQFLIDAISNPVTMKDALNAAAPFIINALNSQNRNLEATAFNFLTKLSAAEKSDNDIFQAMNEIPGFVPTVKEPFTTYNYLLETDYGGPLPIFASDNANKLAMLTMKMMRAW